MSHASYCCKLRSPIGLYSTMEASSHGTDDCSRCASGVLAVMDRFLTFFVVKLSILIFSIFEQLLVSLQGINTTVNDCYSAVEVCIRALERNRTDEKFQAFFEAVKLESASKCDPLVVATKKTTTNKV